MGIVLDSINKHILITEPTIDIEAISIYSAAMDWSDKLENMGYSPPMRAIGKFDMGGGVYSDIIYQLINGWKLKFWSTTEHFIVRGTLLPETPAQSRHIIPADVEYEVSSKATVVTDPTLLEDVAYVKAKTEHVPSDLPEVPTHPELTAQHGSGSWAGATPPQIWEHASRKLTSREVGPTHIASEETVTKEAADIKGPTWTDESLKKIMECLSEIEMPTPKSKAQYLESRL